MSDSDGDKKGKREKDERTYKCDGREEITRITLK